MTMEPGGADHPRSVHVVASVSPAFGGPAYSVPRLCHALSAVGAPASVFSVADAGTSGSDVRAAGFVDRRFTQDFAGVPLLGDLKLSRTLVRALDDSAATVDVIHNHGLWLMPNVAAGRVADAARKPLIMAPRGMLSPAALAFSGLRKRLFWSLVQGPAARRARCYHATSLAEADEIRAFGITVPIAVVPNGIDPPPVLADDRTTRSLRTVLSLGRVHRKKGLDRLIAAWATIASHHPDWRLRIVGPDERGHAAELKALAARLGAARVTVEGPAYEADKWAALAAADLFVLPTLSENFGVVVAEALATGLPVISTKGAPWADLDENGAGWWIDHGAEPLAAVLDQAMALTPAERGAMGRRGRDWMVRDFAWDAIARTTKAVYAWICGKGDRPECVKTD
jgi:glycosyltransferase involved in cell wall biosynthesis